MPNENTVHINNLVLQISKSEYRSHFIKCEVDVLEHLDDTHSLVWKKRLIGGYDMSGKALGLSLFPTPASSPSVRECWGCSPVLPYALRRQGIITAQAMIDNRTFHVLFKADIFKFY